FSSTRILHVIEMNFEVLQHFLGSMMALLERLRTIYRDTRQLTSTVGRHSLEFGQSSLSTASQARSRLARHPLAASSLFAFCLALILRMYKPLTRRRARLSNAFASSVLDGAWSG
ncbi:MAG: hypothetical protein SGPRY_014198, partial [Prymnesium sp.]